MAPGCRSRRAAGVLSLWTGRSWQRRRRQEAGQPSGNRWSPGWRLRRWSPGSVSWGRPSGFILSGGRCFGPASKSALLRVTRSPSHALRFPFFILRSLLARKTLPRFASLLGYLERGGNLSSIPSSALEAEAKFPTPRLPRWKSVTLPKNEACACLTRIRQQQSREKVAVLITYSIWTVNILLAPNNIGLKREFWIRLVMNITLQNPDMFKEIFVIFSCNELPKNEVVCNLQNDFLKISLYLMKGTLAHKDFCAMF